MRRAEIVRQRELTMAKLVQIQINQTDYDNFKSINWNLCYAQKVNNTYTVGQSIFNYLPTARISWLPDYSLFGTNFFNPGAAAVVETNPVAIEFGQRAILDTAGVLKPAEDVGSSGVITFVNKYGPIHPGLKGTSAGPDGVQQQLPIHVEREAAETGFVWLTPVDVVRIWFQQSVSTGAMLSPDFTIPNQNSIVINTVSAAIEVDLTDADTATVQFQNGAWSTIASD
jgi:hypothetical protein